MPSDLAFQDILKIEHFFRQRFGLSFIKPEAKIILLLKEKGSLSMKETMSFLDLSYRGFYILVKRMIQNGIIFMEEDAFDRRVKRISLKDAGFCSAECGSFTQE